MTQSKGWKADQTVTFGFLFTATILTLTTELLSITLSVVLFGYTLRDSLELVMDVLRYQITPITEY
jgi:hypothetical protein